MQSNIVPEALPLADLTWEVSEILLNTQLETTRIPVRLPEPCTLVACVASVIIAGAPAGGPLLTPTVEHIACLIDINEGERRLTRRVGDTSLGSAGATFVTLAALDRSRRYIGRKIRNASPDVGVQFRWKTTSPASYDSALVSLALLIQFDHDAEG